MPPTVTIRPGTSADVGEILTLQRAAYVSEAQLYDDAHLPALVQSFDDLSVELETSVSYVATTTTGRIVGAVRVAQRDATAEVGRLVVAPDQQGRGVGSALLEYVHSDTTADIDRFELFTGDRSHANLRLYERHGYREYERRPLTDGINLVYLERSRE